MKPSTPHNFSWQAVYNDPEGFARYLATENPPSPNHEQVPAFHPDALHPYGGQTQPNAFYPNFEGSSDFSQATVPQHDHRPGDSFDPVGPSHSASPVAANEVEAFLNEPFPSNQPGHYGETVSIEQPYVSQRYSPYYSTSSDDPYASHPFDQNYQPQAFHESSASQEFGQNYPMPAFHAPTSCQEFDQDFQPAGFHEPSSHQFGRNYSPTAFDEPSSHQFGRNYSPTAFDEPSSHQFGRNYSPTAFDEPSSSQQPGQYAVPFDTTDDDAHPIHPQSRATSPASVGPHGEYEPRTSPSPSHTEAATVNVGSSHPHHFDHQELQALQASLALPFPRVWEPEFDASILSQSFSAFARPTMKSLYRIAELGKTDQTLDRPTMIRVFERQGTGISLRASIDSLNQAMQFSDVGEILYPVSKGSSYTFKKGKHYHFVNVICEAHSIISKDLRIHDLPLHFVQIIATLYGQPPQSSNVLAGKLNISISRFHQLISHCKKLLIKMNSPVTIKRNKNNQYFLDLDTSLHKV